jgi:hypothetical protein
MVVLLFSELKWLNKLRAYLSWPWNDQSFTCKCAMVPVSARRATTRGSQCEDTTEITIETEIEIEVMKKKTLLSPS